MDMDMNKDTVMIMNKDINVGINKDKNMKFKMILAQDAGLGIGYKGKLPWPHCKDDMRLFKMMTIGNKNNAVVMGYETWKSLPDAYKPLSDRVNIVFSSNHYTELVNEEKCVAFDNWKNFLEHLSYCEYDEVWIIGGATIYRAAIEQLPITDIIHTTFKRTYTCDCYLDIYGLLADKGLTVLSHLLNETDDYRMEHLEIKGQTKDYQLSGLHSKT
jgi:dihydrofolate reductase